MSLSSACCGLKAAVDNMEKNKHDYVPMKFNLQKQAMAYSLPTPALVRPQARQPWDFSVRFAAKFSFCLRLVRVSFISLQWKESWHKFPFDKYEPK